MLELSGDVGAGKTALTKGIVDGFGSKDEVSSPSFTLSQIYELEDRTKAIHHYDFYRLQDAGIMESEIAESIEDKETVVIVEWAGLVEGVLPEDRLKIEIIPADDIEKRGFDLTVGPKHSHLLKGLN